jgi:hypothetical protein
MGVRSLTPFEYEITAQIFPRRWVIKTAVPGIEGAPSEPAPWPPAGLEQESRKFLISFKPA